MFSFFFVSCSPVRTGNSTKSKSTIKLSNKEKSTEKTEIEKKDVNSKEIKNQESVKQDSASQIPSNSNEKSLNESKKDTSLEISNASENSNSLSNLNNSNKISKNSKKSEKTKLSLRTRFVDTTSISQDLDLSSEKSNSVIKKFEKALYDFDKDNYTQACADAQFYAESFVDGDSLKFEAMFLWSECMIVKNEINDAKNILMKMYDDNKTPSSIFEKVIVRIGQVLCSEGKDKEAEKYFAKLKKEYPKSIYLKIANCAAVKGK